MVFTMESYVHLQHVHFLSVNNGAKAQYFFGLDIYSVILPQKMKIFGANFFSSGSFVHFHDDIDLSKYV
jgi:hypothetical protein